MARGSVFRGRLSASVLAGLSLATLAAGGARAQGAGCGELNPLLQQRQTIAGGLSAKGGKKQIDPRVACTGFNQLVANGSSILKWAEANKDWCQVPDSFIESVKTDHAKAQSIRGKACAVAQQQARAEKQAREGAGSGLLGGGGITGQTRLPQGAL